MRTYTHAILSHVVAGRFSDGRYAAWASAGAALPDLPALAGSAWLALRGRRFSRRSFYGEVCGSRRFALPDAALHSAPALAVPALALAAYGLRGRPSPRGTWFLLGWAGHVASDVLTHGSDARPPLWPLSRWRFESPVSYRERNRHGVPFTAAEHAVLLALGYAALRRRGR
ncbi:metal-dependent hydrolase [Rubrobacter aplysinae]|uniref:metal-dependent hydrolase n=1 Tax=Rubrobacter aplysinae TaxID=909625 RepID=UPI00064B9BDD|nr:metal-dependent hydrolase [Rubrobacter aplysinae]